MIAAYFDHLYVLRLLLDRRADIDASEKTGDTALTLAAQQGSLLCVPELLKRGANKHHINNQGLTAMDRAKHNNKDQVVRFLSQESFQSENVFFPVADFQCFNLQPNLSKIKAKLEEFNNTMDPELQLNPVVIPRLLKLGDSSYSGIKRFLYCRKF